MDSRGGFSGILWRRRVQSRSADHHGQKQKCETPASPSGERRKNGRRKYKVSFKGKRTIKFTSNQTTQQQTTSLMASKKDRLLEPNKPSITFACILDEGVLAPLVEAGQPIRKEVLTRIAQNIDFQVNATRVFRESPLVGDKSLVIIVRNHKAYIATFSPQLSIRIAIAYLLEMIQSFEIDPKLHPGGEKNKKRNSEVYKHMRILMEDRMYFYSYDPEADKFRSIFKDVDDTKLVLHDCIEKLLERTQKTEILEEKTILLSNQASKMKLLATELSWKEYWKTKKCAIIGGATAVLTTTVVIGGVVAALI
jgi:hypothetical protein